MESEILGWI